MRNFSLDITSKGNYNISELLKAYDNSYKTIKESFDNTEANHKLLVSIDYSVKSRDNNVLTLVAYFYFGKYGVYLPRGDWRIYGGQSGHGGRCGIYTYINYEASDRIEQEEFAHNTIHNLDVFFTDIENNVDIANNITMTTTAANFNYTPYTPSWYYFEGFINTTQNPNYQWSNCLTVYYMDQYESNIKELSDLLVTYKGKSIVLFDLVSDFMSKWIQGDSWLAQFICPEAVIFANSHPRIYSQANDFIQ